jgi:hypothetical protein
VNAPLTPEELKARKLRSIAIALGLIAFVAIIFTVTLVRLQGNVPEPRF